MSTYNDHLLFTPASNVKILTTLACLQTFGDSIPAFRFFSLHDTLLLQPMADATFLNPKFAHQKAYDFIKTHPHIQVSMDPSRLTPYASGWAWDDYHYAFQPERSWFPIYGNMVSVTKAADSVTVSPPFFRDFVTLLDQGVEGPQYARWSKANIFTISGAKDSLSSNIPFITSNELLLTLLSDTLNTPVQLSDSFPDQADTLFSHTTQYVLRKMMLPSDNFLAEHLLIQSALLSGTHDTDLHRQQLLLRWQSFLPQNIRWVDGSGLSRYNLISPASMTAILNEIYKLKDWDYIQSIFPIGGVSGTIKNWYSRKGEPYVYAKTGTLSNNHNLSGFLKTQSGKILIFSFMNNHFLGKSSAAKIEMETLLEKIHNAY